MSAKKQRIILKISGEFLQGDKGFGYDHAVLNQLTEDIEEIQNLNYQIGIVLGGGNIVRGRELIVVDRVAADNVGMLATVQNAIVVSEFLKEKGNQIEVFSAFPMPKIARYYTFLDADKALNENKICFFSGGTGNPFFSTDTGAVLRAIELNCDLVLKGTKVDGIYTADPKKDKNAKFLKEISYTEALNQQLNIMDMTAFSLARDYQLTLKVFDITKKGNIRNAVLSNDVGTLVK